MCNVTKGVSQPQPHIIKYSDTEKLRYDAYLAMSDLLLLSYVVGLMRSWVNVATFFG